MDRKKKILEMCGEMGLVRPRDVEAAGVQREYLLRMLRDGELVREGRGLYALPGSLSSENITLAEVAKRVPGAVVCLLSALQFHGLTTQSPHEVWIAVEYGAWTPKIGYPPLAVVRHSSVSFGYGIEEHIVDRVPVRIYSAAKTVADCFKFRNRIGLDTAIEALKEAWGSGRAGMDDIWNAARVCRVANVMRPYLEAVV